MAALTANTFFNSLQFKALSLSLCTDEALRVVSRRRGIGRALVSHAQLSSVLGARNQGGRSCLCHASEFHFTARVPFTNSVRSLSVRHIEHPFTPGPDYNVAGSFDQQIGIAEALDIVSFKNPDLNAIKSAAESVSVQQISDTPALYDSIAAFLSPPASLDQSDANFGAMRGSLSGHTLTLMQTHGNTTYAGVDFGLTSAQVQQLCGDPLDALQATRSLFVLDFGDLAQYNDPFEPHKYIANVQGFFCVSQIAGKLMPLAIRILDTGLVYTPFDPPHEWMLAKMALNAAETQYQQVRHFAECHLVLEPVRVELMRAMDPSHAVYQFLSHHLRSSLAFPILGRKITFDHETPADKTFGWGADGSIRFMVALLRDRDELSFAHSFPDQVVRHGWNHIPNHKYATYGTWYHDALERFVHVYVHDLYASDEQLLEDRDLQLWAHLTSQVEHVLDFPRRFTTRAQLTKVLVHVAFQCAVKHHILFGHVTWNAVSIPFSVPALWKPLPLAKGAAFNLNEYMMPRALMPALIQSMASFSRKTPAHLTLAHGYTDAAFPKDSPPVRDAVDRFAMDMRAIECKMTQLERHELHPITHLLPSKLPYFEWV